MGQILLLEKYSKFFRKFNLKIAQFLLTSRELREKESLENIKNTYNRVKNHAITIVNENDVVSIKELSFGDNDGLAKELMIALDFDTLVFLTKKGQLIRNGKKLTKTKFYQEKDYDNLKVETGGSGGLKSKLDCAKFLTSHNRKVFLGKCSDGLLNIISDKNKRTEFLR